MAITSASPEKYSHIDFKPPEGVRKAAKRGLELRREYGRGGTAVGVARARDLSNGKQVSPSTAKRMKAYFDRHQPDQKAKGFDSGEEVYPSAGRVAWLLWGGDAGYSWAKKLVKQMEAADKKVSGSAGNFVLWHGAHKWNGPPTLQPAGKGKSENGSGFYLTTSVDTARSYAKGGGSLLRFEVDANLAWADEVDLPFSEMVDFVVGLPRLRNKNKVLDDLASYHTRTKKAALPAYVLENLLHNHDALKGAVGPTLARWFSQHGVDAGHVRKGNEDWVVLYNLDKVISYEKVKEGVDSPRVRASTEVIAYHGGSHPIDKFDPKKSAMGFWFSEDKDKILNGESGAASLKWLMKVKLHVSKTAGWEEYDKYLLDQLISMGYDSVKLDDDWIVFDPSKIEVLEKTKLSVQAMAQAHWGSESFRKWFGNSKVVDKDGKPLVVHHGTDHGGFTKFDPDEAKAERRGMLFFTDSHDMASSYVGTRSHDDPVVEPPKDVEDLLKRKDDFNVDVSYFYIPDWEENGPRWRNITTERDKDDLKDAGWEDEDGNPVEIDDADIGIAVTLISDDSVFGEYVIMPGHSEDQTDDLLKDAASVNKKKAGVYNLYLKIEKPYEVDADDNNWDAIPQEVEDEDGNPEPYTVTTNEIGRMAKDMGCDGAIIRNVNDYGSRGGGYPADVFIVFSPNQVKSVYNKGTYSTADNDIRANSNFVFEEGNIYEYNDLPPVVQSDIDLQFDDPDEVDNYVFEAVTLTPSDIADMTKEAGDNYQWGLVHWTTNRTGIHDIEELDDPAVREAFLEKIPKLRDVMKSIESRGLDYPPVGGEGTHRAIAHYLLGRDMPYLAVVDRPITKTSASCGCESGCACSAPVAQPDTQSGQQPPSDMTVSNLQQIMRDVAKLLEVLHANMEIMGWAEDKVSQAKAYIADVKNYIETDFGPQAVHAPANTSIAVAKVLDFVAEMMSASASDEIPENGTAEIDVSDMTSTRAVVAYSKVDTILGIATWDDERGELEIVKVDSDFRRQGIAEALVKSAEALNGQALSDTGERSAEGTALLEKMGRQPADLTRTIPPREAESLGAMMMSKLYRDIGNGTFMNRVKSKWTPFQRKTS